MRKRRRPTSNRGGKGSAPTTIRSLPRPAVRRPVPSRRRRNCAACASVCVCAVFNSWDSETRKNRFAFELRRTVGRGKGTLGTKNCDQCRGSATIRSDYRHPVRHSSDANDFLNPYHHTIADFSSTGAPTVTTFEKVTLRPV